MNRNLGRHVTRFQLGTAATGRVHVQLKRRFCVAPQPGYTHIFRSTQSEPLEQDRRLGQSVVRLSIPVCYGTAHNRHRSSRPTNRNCQISVLDLIRPCSARDASRQTAEIERKPNTTVSSVRDNKTQQLHDKIIFDKRRRIVLSYQVLSHYQL